MKKYSCRLGSERSTKLLPQKCLYDFFPLLTGRDHVTLLCPIGRYQIEEEVCMTEVCLTVELEPRSPTASAASMASRPTELTRSCDSTRTALTTTLHISPLPLCCMLEGTDLIYKVTALFHPCFLILMEQTPGDITIYVTFNI